MANYTRSEIKKSMHSLNHSLPIAKGKIYLFFLIFLALLPAVISGPARAFGKDKIVVLPFKVETTEPAGNLNTDLQGMFSKDLTEMGYEVVDARLINSSLGNDFSYANPEKTIIPLGKANNAAWIIIGELTEKEGSIHLNVKAMDTNSAKTPFSVMMIENDMKKLPEGLKKIAESLSSQIKKNILIADIIVNGNKRIDDDGILNIIESKKGERFDQDKLDRDLRTIYKLGFFDDVNFETTDSPAGKIITFNLVEKPTIIKISFVGNKAKKEDKLREEIGIKQYSALNRSEIRQSINRLLDLYKNDGYYDVKIEAKIKDLPDNEVTLTYLIDEGEKVYIKDIEFRGNKVFTSKELRKVMLTKKKSWLSWFTDSGILDKKKLEYDMQQLTIFYDNHGYIKARVGEPEITYDEKKKGLRLVITIIEGKQYIVNDVDFEGDLLVPAEALKHVINIKKGDPFSRKNVYTEIDKIKDLYADMGYAYAEVRPLPEEIEGTNLVNVHLKIEKNKRVRIERINIYGNDITKDKVIRRELLIAEGDYFNRMLLKASEANINRLEIFEEPEVKQRKGSSDDQMIIDIEGKEKLQRSISFSAGYGGYEKLAVQLQFEDNNMFGTGRDFSIEAMAGSASTRFNATLKDPWLFDKPVRGTISVYDWDIDYDEYTRQRLGGNAGLAFLLGLDQFTRGTVQYTYDNSTVTNVYPGASTIIQDMAGTLLTSSLTIGVERNSKDRWWDTSKGSLNAFTFEYAGGFFGGDVAFNKYLLTSIWYLPEFKNTVLVAEAQLGYVHGRSGGSLPLYEKFQLGGIDSVRGYEWGSIAPVDPLTYDELAGDYMWLYKLEYRVPIKRGEQGMTALVFFDAGNAFNKGTNWKVGSGASVGLGIRWYSPMGPLRLEYGWKLKDNVNDTASGKFEFKIGGSF